MCFLFLKPKLYVKYYGEVFSFSRTLLPSRLRLRSFFQTERRVVNDSEIWKETLPACDTICQKKYQAGSRMGFNSALAGSGTM